MKTYDNILCVIPARAGSQGIIDKNLQLIWGMPLVEHSITHALDAGLYPQNICVSSDSDEILNIALRFGVIANERPSKISGPTSSTEETLIWEYDAHARYQKYHNLTLCEHVLLLQPTSPIRFKGTLNKFIDYYLNGGFDSALTTTRFHDFFWNLNNDTGRWNEKNQQWDNITEWRSTYNPKKRPMRQELSIHDDKFFDNGNMYITNAGVLQNTACRIGKNVGVFPISELEGMQIDTHEDLEIFRAVFSGEIPKKVGLREW